jgi:hypothetical protein
MRHGRLDGGKRRMTGSDEETLLFIAASFPSVWALELLFAVKRFGASSGPLRKTDAMTEYDFLAGAVAFGFVVCGLFFLRFWRRTRDPFFIAFALAFALLGVSQAVLALANIPTEDRGAIFVIRLVAFALILITIIRKNRSS